MTAKIQLQQLDAIIFDLGGVILHLDYQATIRALSETVGQDVAPLYTQAKQDHLFDQFERGEIKSRDFFRGLVERLSENRAALLARLEDPQFVAQLEAGWNAMLLHIPDANISLLQKLRNKVPTYLLSNTNQSHLRQFHENYKRDHEEQFGPFTSLFESCYYSHELGQRKPETRIYETVLQRHHLRAERTLFIDDNQDNLKGAAQVGLQTRYHRTNSDLPAQFC